MAFAPYVTLPEFKTLVGLSDSDDDVEIVEVLDDVTGWIDEFCQRHFWQDTNVVRTFVACNPRLVEFGPFHDLMSVTSVKTDDAGDGTFETTWTSDDYQLQPVNRPTGRPYTQMEAVGTRLFPIRYTAGSRANRVEITGTWGWAAVPGPVKRACKEQSNRELKRRLSPEGITGFGNEFGLIRVSNRLDPDVERNLVRFVHPNAAVLVA